MLDGLGTDITKLAEEDKLDPFIGFAEDLDKLAVYLTRRMGNNPVVTSPSSTYRNSLVEGLAMQIVTRKVIRPLFNKRLVKLDANNLLSGIKSHDQIRERIQAILNELEKSRDTILFLEEIHQVYNDRSDGNMQTIARAMYPAFSGAIQIIGSSPSQDFEKIIELQPALKRLFQRIEIGLPSTEETLAILLSLKPKYEDFHAVTYSDEAIAACVSLSERYIKDISLPDSAIGMFDEIGARVRILNMHVPKHIEDLEKNIEEIKEQKNQAVKNQQYEKAADLRDKESKLIRQLEFAKVQWEEEYKVRRFPVLEDHVFEVFKLRTGLSVEALKKNGEEIQGADDDDQVEKPSADDSYFKSKVEEFDLENKTSIKIGDIPDYLKTSLQQYILFFKEYLEKVKGTEIFFEVTKIKEGLRIDIDPEEIDDFEKLNDWFNEYLDYIRRKNETFKVNFEKEVEEKEAEIIMAELKNQVRHLESQMEIIQLRVKQLDGKEDVFNHLTLKIPDQHKYLIEQGYADLMSFKQKLKEDLGQGKAKIRPGSNSVGAPSKRLSQESTRKNIYRIISRNGAATQRRAQYVAFVAPLREINLRDFLAGSL